MTLVPHTTSVQGTRFEVAVTAKFLHASGVFDAPVNVVRWSSIGHAPEWTPVAGPVRSGRIGPHSHPIGEEPVHQGRGVLAGVPLALPVGSARGRPVASSATSLPFGRTRRRGPEPTFSTAGSLRDRSPGPQRNHPYRQGFLLPQGRLADRSPSPSQLAGLWLLRGLSSPQWASDAVGGPGRARTPLPAATPHDKRASSPLLSSHGVRGLL